MIEIISEITQKTIKCNICGGSLNFINKKDCSLRESLCPICGSSRRNNDVAKIILDTFLFDPTLCLRTSAPNLSYLSIFEAQASGTIHNSLNQLPNYVCSEYFDNIPNGVRNKNGILCENLQDLSFPEESFDLVLTQDVLEHVDFPEKAFSEINRVLKRGGYHIFTIPYHENKPSLRRIVVENGVRVNKYPQVYHGDPLRKQGSLVFTDFGPDMIPMIENFGFSLETFPCERWYDPSEIPYIVDEKEYERYLNYTTEGNMLKYFKYNSWVFRAKKQRDMNNYA